MKIINKYVIHKDNGEEELLEVGQLYNFQIDNFKPEIGKLVSIIENIIKFDCSSNFNSNIKSYELHRVHSIIKI